MPLNPSSVAVPPPAAMLGCHRTRPRPVVPVWKAPPSPFRVKLNANIARSRKRGKSLERRCMPLGCWMYLGQLGQLGQLGPAMTLDMWLGHVMTCRLGSKATCDVDEKEAP
eukprot:Skav203610  [mRNA]  locus=scaffold935:430562:431212:+ [translate_table: standard]